MERDDAVGGPRRLLVNTKAPRRFTTPPDHGPCLTYPRLSGTKPFSLPRLSSDDTRSTRPTLSSSRPPPLSLSLCTAPNSVARAATPSVNCQRPNAWKRSMWRDHDEERTFVSFLLFGSVEFGRLRFSCIERIY